MKNIINTMRVTNRYYRTRHEPEIQQQHLTTTIIKEVTVNENWELDSLR